MSGGLFFMIELASNRRQPSPDAADATQQKIRRFRNIRR